MREIQERESKSNADRAPADRLDPRLAASGFKHPAKAYEQERDPEEPRKYCGLIQMNGHLRSVLALL
jgi:hypothetical protein